MQRIRAGLLLVEGKTVEVVVSSKTHSLTDGRYREVKDQLLEGRRVVLPTP